MAEANTSALATLPQSTTALDLDTIVSGFKGVLKANCSLNTFWVFAAMRHGITMPKGQRNSKATKAALEKKGVKPEQIKALRTEFDKARKVYWQQCPTINGLFAMDASYRKTMKLWENKKGELCATTQYRKVKGADAEATIEQLQRERDEAVAALEGIKAKALPA